MDGKYAIEKCRLCSSKNFAPIISLGNQYVTGFASQKDESKIQVPLDLILCEDCKLLQLKHNAPPESMWGDQYWYKSGINSMIKNNLNEIVKGVEKLQELKEKDLVVDIGCNDGTMLGFYERKDLNLVGFEPSNNVAKEAEEKGYSIINDFFNSEKFKEKFGERKAKVITAISMFYDLEDPNKFMEDIKEVLDKDGLFVIQQNYLVTMLKNNAFDNICHEHREYYSFYSLKQLMDKHGFEIFDVSFNELNGGSIRTYIKFKENTNLKPFEGAKERIEQIINDEKNLGLDTKKPYLEFAERIGDVKNKILKFLKEEKLAGKKICGCGASTRGNVLLQYFELGPDLIDCIFDKNPDKEGKLTVGSWIPVTSPNNIEKYNPDYQIVIIWHLFESLDENERSFLERGGKFIVPLTKLKIVSKEGESFL